MKKILSLVLVLVMVLSLAACSSKEEIKTTTTENTQKDEAEKEATPENEVKKNFTLKFSTVSIPGDAHTEAIYVFRDAIEELTDGQIKVKIFHSGSLFSQESDQEALLSGDLEMAYTSPFWIADYVPSVSMFTAGYIYKDYDHMTAVLNGDIGRKVFEQISEELNMVPLGAFYLGSRQINVNGIGREVKTPEDLKGVNLRMPNAPSWLFLGEALGANPTPLSFSELYMALSTGTVDGQDNPLPTIKNAKFYEVTDQISLTNHVIDSIWPAINKDVWNEMGPELQEKMYEAINIAKEACDTQNIQAEAELVEFFISEGLTVVEPDVEAFMTKVQAAYLENEEVTSKWDMDLFEEVQSLVK